MTTVAVLADPPTDAHALPALADGPLSTEERIELYRAALADVAAAVDASGGETLINYRAPDDDEDADAAEPAVREVVDPVVDDARYEVQVGSTHSARVGNTVTHLLEREGVDTAAVVSPSAPFLTRSIIDGAAMKLRSADVVLGSAPDGRVHYAGFGTPIDFEDAFATPALETLTSRAREDGLDVDFVEMLPLVERPADLRDAAPLLAARRRAGRRLPERTDAVVQALDLRVDAASDGPTLVRE